MKSAIKGVGERRRSSAAHIRALLDNALDPVMGLDGEGRVRFWNPQAEATFGWPREEAIGRELAEMVIPRSDRSAFREALSRPGDAPSRRIEIPAQRRDGSLFPLELTLTTIPKDPEYRFSAFARDMTERKAAEKEREGLLVEAEQARTLAESASRVKDEFLSILSHELRTPLTAIVGWIYLLRGGRLDETTTARGLETIERNAAAQAKTINDILDLSRIVAAKFRLRVRPMELGPVVAAAIDNLMPAANAKELHLKAIMDPHAGLVSGDPDRLRQVAWNLLGNAVKFTPRGGSVTVRLGRAGESVELTVEDTGVGIEPELLPHVFDPFRQGDSSNTRSHGGLGIGLAVVRHLAELHGGSVEATSPGPGAGATFKVSLPVLSGEVREEDLGAAAGELAPDSPSLAGVRVLLVDDGPDVREVLTAILRHSGATVTAVASVEEALAAIAAATPDVLLSEIEIRGETGYSLVRRMRSLPPDQGGLVPAVALSAYARTEDRVEALRAGFQMHLAKPVQPAELVVVVASLAGRPRRP